MTFQVDPEKKDKFYRGVRGMSPLGIEKRDKILKGAANIFLSVGGVSGVSRGVWAFRAGQGMSVVLVSAMLSFVTWLAFALMLRILARMARLRSAGIVRQESVEIQGDTLTYIRKFEAQKAPQEYRIRLMETTVCQDKNFHSLMFTGGVEDSTGESVSVEQLCDLEIVDYYEPSLTEYLLDRGIVLHDWDDAEDPACQRPEQFRTK